MYFIVSKEPNHSTGSNVPWGYDLIKIKANEEYLVPIAFINIEIGNRYLNLRNMDFYATLKHDTEFEPAFKLEYKNQAIILIEDQEVIDKMALENSEFPFLDYIMAYTPNITIKDSMFTFINKFRQK